MGMFLVVAIMAVIGIIIMMARLNMRRFLGYPNTVDIVCTIIFVILFEGSFGGMVVAGFASLFMSIMLWVLRSSMGCERLSITWKPVLTFRGLTLCLPKVFWLVIPASACQPHWLAKLTMQMLSK